MQKLVHKIIKKVLNEVDNNFSASARFTVDDIDPDDMKNAVDSLHPSYFTYIQFKFSEFISGLIDKGIVDPQFPARCSINFFLKIFGSKLADYFPDKMYLKFSIMSTEKSTEHFWNQESDTSEHVKNFKDLCRLEEDGLIDWDRDINGFIFSTTVNIQSKNDLAINVNDIFGAENNLFDMFADLPNESLQTDWLKLNINYFNAVIYKKPLMVFKDKKSDFIIKNVAFQTIEILDHKVLTDGYDSNKSVNEHPRSRYMKFPAFFELDNDTLENEHQWTIRIENKSASNKFTNLLTLSFLCPHDLTPESVLDYGFIDFQTYRSKIISVLLLNSSGRVAFKDDAFAENIEYKEMLNAVNKMSTSKVNDGFTAING